MSARTLATASTFIGPRRPLRELNTIADVPAIAAATMPSETVPSAVTMAARLTGASMRLLEVSLAAAAMTTALLLGVGR